MVHNALSWLHECCLGRVLGRMSEREAEKHCLFSCKVAAAGDEGQLVCEAGAATLVSRCDWFTVPATCGYSFVRSFIWGLLESLLTDRSAVRDVGDVDDVCDIDEDDVGDVW